MVLLGANYGPCMTRDNILQRIIDGRREQEAMDSGCCVRRDSSGCVQVLSSDDCPNEVVINYYSAIAIRASFKILIQ